MSIDSPGARMFTDTNSPDNFNYIDTYIEYVTEVIMKYDTAIPEAKNRQHKELQQHKHLQVISSTVESIFPFVLSCRYLTEIYSGYPDRFAFQFIKEIIPPPPRFLKTDLPVICDYYLA